VQSTSNHKRKLRKRTKIESQSSGSLFLMEPKINLNLIPTKFIYKFIHDNLFLIIWYLFNWILSMGIELFPLVLTNNIFGVENYLISKIILYISNVLVLIYTCIMYSTYCIEYKLRNMYPQDLLANRLTYIENHLIYYSGYTIFVAILGLFLPTVIFWGVSEFMLTNLLIINMYVKSIPKNRPIPIYHFQKKYIPGLVNRLLLRFLSNYYLQNK